MSDSSGSNKDLSFFVAQRQYHGQLPNHNEHIISILEVSTYHDGVPFWKLFVVSWKANAREGSHSRDAKPQHANDHKREALTRMLPYSLFQKRAWILGIAIATHKNRTPVGKT